MNVAAYLAAEASAERKDRFGGGYL